MAKNATRSSAKAHAKAAEPSAQERILEAAEHVFAEFGYDGTSIRQIAARAGVPVTLISYHFGQKLGVYRAIFEVRTPTIVMQRMAGLALAALEDSPQRRLEMVIKAVIVPMLKLRVVEGHGAFGTLLAREAADVRADERGIMKDMLDPVAKAVTEELQRCLPDRSHAEIHWAYQMMIGTMVFIMSDTGRIKRVSDGDCDPQDTDATIRHVLPMLLYGVRGPTS